MDEKVKDWYSANYPNDEVVEDMNEAITFREVWDGLKERRDFYGMVRVGDSLVRQNIFGHIAELIGKHVDYVYFTWLFGV